MVYHTLRFYQIPRYHLQTKSLRDTQILLKTTPIRPVTLTPLECSLQSKNYLGKYCCDFNFKLTRGLIKKIYMASMTGFYGLFHKADNRCKSFPLIISPRKWLYSSFPSEDGYIVVFPWKIWLYRHFPSFNSHSPPPGENLLYSHSFPILKIVHKHNRIVTPIPFHGWHCLFFFKRSYHKYHAWKIRALYIIYTSGNMTQVKVLCNRLNGQTDELALLSPIIQTILNA